SCCRHRFEVALVQAMKSVKRHHCLDLRRTGSPSATMPQDAAPEAASACQRALALFLLEPAFDRLCGTVPNIPKETAYAAHRKDKPISLIYLFRSNNIGGSWFSDIAVIVF